MGLRAAIWRWFVFLGLLATQPGCQTISRMTVPRDRLTFPRAPLYVSEKGRFYDVHHTGKADFAILKDETGRLNVLAYDDTGSGQFDRLYRLSDYASQDVPHLILMIDSVPYRMVAKRYEAGEWQWFYPPQKVIPPFPSMTIVIFNEIMGGPPLGGAVERYYERRTGSVKNVSFDLALGWHFPWQNRMDYMDEKYWQTGMMYLNPPPWYQSELARAKKAADNSLNSVAIAYLVSGSGMASKLGAKGVNEELDQIEQFCMQLLYERRGAIKISILSDHGHNLTPSTNVAPKICDLLRQAGFHPVKRIKDARADVFVEVDGLCTYCGVFTSQPKKVADVLLADPAVQLAVYQEGESVMIRDAHGSAAIDCRGTWLRYKPIEGDVLGYKPLLEKLASEGKVDGGGFVEDRVWLEATRDAEWPDVPRRVWDAFHRQVVNPASVMFTLNDGYCAGVGGLDKFIAMASTHGGLNQINSDAVLMTMTGPVPTALRSRDVMQAIEPRYTPYLPPRSLKRPPASLPGTGIP
jgi:hypothetical protein